VTRAVRPVERSPVPSGEKSVFGLEGDVEGEAEQRGVDGPRTVDGHLWTDTSGTTKSPQGTKTADEANYNDYF